MNEFVPDAVIVKGFPSGSNTSKQYVFIVPTENVYWVKGVLKVGPLLMTLTVNEYSILSLIESVTLNVITLDEAAIEKSGLNSKVIPFTVA